MVARPAAGETKSAGSSFFFGRAEDPCCLPKECHLFSVWIWCLLLPILLCIFLSLCCIRIRGDGTCTCGCGCSPRSVSALITSCSGSSKRLRLTPAFSSSWSSCVTKKLAIKVPVSHTSRKAKSRRESLEVVTILVFSSFFFLGPWWH
jgi:hypothetical protein